MEEPRNEEEEEGEEEQQNQEGDTTIMDISVESQSEIQTYLNTFNKEIQDDNNKKAVPDEGLMYFDTDKVGLDDPGTLYSLTEGSLFGTASESGFSNPTVTYLSTNNLTASGLQQIILSLNPSGPTEYENSNAPTSSDQVMDETHIKTEADSSDGNTSENNNEAIPISTRKGQTIVANIPADLKVDDPQTLQMLAKMAEQAVAAAAATTSATDNNQAENSSGSFHTVTILPSSNASGEHSYVLFLSPGKDTDVQDSEDTLQEYQRIASTLVNTKSSSEGADIRGQIHSCNFCNYCTPKRYLLSRHMKSHSDERPHACSVCKRGFKTTAALQNHENTHTGNRPYACKCCTSTFTTSGELVRHMRYKHTHEKPHQCTECDYASVELSKLKRHMRCHTGERPYSCPHCSYASPDTYKLKRHLRIHTGEKPYECDICNARFTQSNSLKAHKLIHSGKKPSFNCPFCPTTCGRKTDMRIHIQKLHSCDSLHKCKRCGKVFQDRYSFKLHKKTHEGEKCFKCELCPYASISERHLQTHMLIHTDQKPFQCTQCSQSFRQKQLLKRHTNIYHNPNYVPPIKKEKNLQCPECDKAFRYKSSLIRHLVVHDPNATAADREAAMNIGKPKADGEMKDGEEDEYEGTDEDEDENENDGVVVFEVIQVANGSQVTLAATATSNAQETSASPIVVKDAFSLAGTNVNMHTLENMATTREFGEVILQNHIDGEGNIKCKAPEIVQITLDGKQTNCDVLNIKVEKTDDDET